ncbi:MAG: SUF system NifU family Fe-S cluster assembly protein [Acidobacteria bacterium]|nr:SUF system NifU family Fe-S cluster assembly protein [Acidobacteriota bacterium]
MEDNKFLDIDPLMMEFLLEHYKHPHNFGELDPAEISFEEGNPSCGDQIKITLNTKDGLIEDIKFKGKGCIVSQAAASILTDMVKGKKVDEVKKISKEEMLENLVIPIGPMRLKCALLALKVLKSGLYGKNFYEEDDDE